MEPTLAEVVEWAREAGKILRDGFGGKLTIEYKSPIDPVTEIDRAAEDLLVGRIRARFSDHTIYTEEAGPHSGVPEHVWFVDPLDGTVNYSHGMPIFAVSIGYVAHGTLQLGVVYDPIREEMYTAQRGQGAYLNGERLFVSQIDDLIHSLLCTGFPYDALVSMENNLDNYSRFALLTQGVRRLGSAALDLCYVANGRLDGFWEIKLKTWDIAAGALIVLEAGGLVTDIEGGQNYLVNPVTIIAANPSIHHLMLNVLSNRLD